jgi:MFS family permease
MLCVPGMRSRYYKWLVVFMLWFVCLLNYADRQAIYSVFPLLKREFHLNTLQLGYLASSFMWIYALAGPVGGWIADRVKRKTVILTGLIFWSVITVATALATSFQELVLFRALEGLGEACYFPASMAMLSAYHGPETRSRAMSWHQSSIYVGTIAGGTAAGFLADRYGWRSSFYLFGIAGVLLGILLIACLKEPAESPAHALPNERNIPLRETGRYLFGKPMPLILMVVFIGANFVNVVFLTWLPYYLNTTFHMTMGRAGWNATAYLQAGSVVGVLTGGMLADRWVRKHAGGRMLVQAFGLLIGTPFLALTGMARAIPVLLIAVGGFGLCRGFYDANLSAALHDVVPVRLRATAVGVLNSLGWLGAGVGPIALAWASVRYGMGVCLSATAGVYLLVAGLLFYGVRRFMPRIPAGQEPTVVRALSD